jgi:thiol-disulfide isomerase/thioredoxin
MSCKESDNSFELRVFTDNEIDSIQLWPSWVDKEFVDTTLFNIISKSDNGEFVFKGELPHPYIMNLYAFGVADTENFFIEKGSTDIYVLFGGKYRQEVRFAKGHKSPTQKEYDLLRTTKLDPLKEAWWESENPISREEYGKQVDSVLLDHLKANPNSYVALWLMLNSFSEDFAYREKYEKAFDGFSDEIKQLDIFKKFKEKITFKKDFSFVNRDFPLKDINETETTFNLKDFKDKKYLLIDFWFSNCGPCLATMPKLKPIYNKYKTKGFEIVSISTDGNEKITDWKRVIEEKEFDWKHYLDLSGDETFKLKIRRFPTTFLIDADGNIIKKNITSENLEKFLNDSL